MLFQFFLFALCMFTFEAAGTGSSNKNQPTTFMHHLVLFDCDSDNVIYRFQYNSSDINARLEGLSLSAITFFSQLNVEADRAIASNCLVECNCQQE